MKKQFIAKLLVLGLALTMLPTVAFAARVNGKPSDNSPYFWDSKNNTYYYYVDDTTYDPAPAPSATTKPEEPAPVVVEKVEDVKTETNEAGQTVSTATVEAEVAEDGSAAVEVTDKAVEDLIAQVGTETDVVVLTVAADSATKATVAVPAQSLAKLAAETGADLTVESSVASITIPNSALATVFEGAKTVEIVAEAKEDGTVEIGMLADGKAVKDIPGGLAVAIPVQVKADEVADVYLVLPDGTSVKLEWKIVDGKLQLNLTATGTIRINKK